MSSPFYAAKTDPAKYERMMRQARRTANIQGVITLTVACLIIAGAVYLISKVL